MTLPDNWDFGTAIAEMMKNPRSGIDQTWRDFIYDLRDMYREIAYNVNGTLRSDTFPGSFQWKPNLDGSTTGSFTYDPASGGHQTGWALRQGNIIELWFDIQWTATTASGDLYLELPYEVASSNDTPFVGVLQASGITYTAGSDLVINAIPDTYRGDIYYTVSGSATGKQQVVSTGQLIGHIRYIGKTNE